MITSLNLVVVLFCVVMAANIVALVRHWRIMRAMTITLDNLIETQNLYRKVIERRVGVRHNDG